MKKFFFLAILLISSFSLKNGVYIIIYNNFYLSNKYNLLSLSEASVYDTQTNFRIKLSNKYDKNSLCFIEKMNSNLRAGIIPGKSHTIFIDSKIKSYNKWNFIKINSTNYYLQNIIGCYLKIKYQEIVCEFISIEEADVFQLIKIYEEVSFKKSHNKLIDNEPIDVLIKYIDLRDPFLKRKNIHQIEKDIDNEELRYSIRSILINIPWIRKIFILMPNKKVKYFKKYELIHDKIIYVKDKDLLGFDSSNSLAFQFRFWKMKEFGISDNFIVMDDDCFIGKPLNKTDFFYVKNNKVVPLIINSKFHEIKKFEVEKKLLEYYEIIKKTNEEQDAYAFEYSQYLTYLFLLNIFQKSLNIPKFTHNAIPVNSNELKEIYDLVYNSEFNETTLFSKYRHVKSLQFQTFILAYTFIKYKKKVKNISHKYIVNNQSILSNYNYQLFCINTIPYGNTNLSFLISRIVMEKLFPVPTPYEIINYSLPSLSYKSLKLMTSEINDINLRYNHLNQALKITNIFHFLLYLFLFVSLIYIKINIEE